MGLGLKSLELYETSRKLLSVAKPQQCCREFCRLVFQCSLDHSSGQDFVARGDNGSPQQPSYSPEPRALIPATVGSTLQVGQFDTPEVTMPLHKGPKFSNMVRGRQRRNHEYCLLANAACLAACALSLFDLLLVRLSWPGTGHEYGGLQEQGEGWGTSTQLHDLHLKFRRQTMEDGFRPEAVST